MQFGIKITKKLIVCIDYINRQAKFVLLNIGSIECETVFCFVDPCSYAKCDKHPEAVCRYVNINFFY